MAVKIINLAQLYPREMNIYGDTGNIKVLLWRLQHRGFKTALRPLNIGDKLPADTDIIVGGGGQDSGQGKIMPDLLKKGDELRAMAGDGVTMLLVCGLYQLFGHRFVTDEQQEIKGISVFDAETLAGQRRLIGNIVVQSPFGRLVGFENHSGLTKLANDQLPLGKVIKGQGNDGSSGKEGAVMHNVFGTYLHGPILPKNPRFADELLLRAIKRRYGASDLSEIDDSLALRAADIAAKRP
ncbi:MAG TPA: glutamine amidotransferase [Candidatus Saccharimonadales bacterium]